MKCLAILAALAVGACVPSAADIAAMIKAAGSDTASICVQVTTPWGGATVSRDNYSNSDNRCGIASIVHGAAAGGAPMILWNGTGPKPQFIAPAP